MVCGTEPKEILKTVIAKKIPAIMSYLSNDKWHVTKVVMTNIGANIMDVELIQDGKPRPMNIQISQTVSMSLKHGCGKFIFETKVLGLEPSSGHASGGKIVLAVPQNLKLIQRRSYFRVKIPDSLDVNIQFWQRHHAHDDSEMPQHHCCQGKLIDISAGGIQIATDAKNKSDLREGQFVGIQFTPMPYEQPLIFTAQIRTIFPTADNQNISIGLQIVGLETTPKGRKVLNRLVAVTEQYYQVNRTGAKHQEMHTISQ